MGLYLPPSPHLDLTFALALAIAIALAHCPFQYNVDKMDPDVAGRNDHVYPDTALPQPVITPQLPPKETRSNEKRILGLIGILVLLLMGVTSAAIYFGVKLKTVCKTPPCNPPQPSTCPVAGCPNEPDNSPAANTAVAIIPALDADDRQIIYQGKDRRLKFATWRSATDTWASYSYDLSPALSAKMNTPLAQLNNPSVSRRVFFIDDNSVLSDAAFDTGQKEWKLGSLAASKLHPANESKLTAITYDNGGLTTEWIYWQAGNPFSPLHHFPPHPDVCARVRGRVKAGGREIGYRADCIVC